VKVDAIMLMPPYVIRDGVSETRSLFSEISKLVDLPLIFQNAPAPLGPSYGPDVVKMLLDDIPEICYVKEETVPGGQRISSLLADAPASLQGVFGGAGGRLLLDELNRGVIGAMPACEITEVHVRIWDAFSRGD